MIDEVTGKNIPGPRQTDSSLKISGPTRAYFKFIDHIMSHAYEIPRLEIYYNKLFVSSSFWQMVECLSGEELYLLYRSVNTELVTALSPYFVEGCANTDEKRVVASVEQKNAWSEARNNFDTCGLLRLSTKAELVGDMVMIKIIPFYSNLDVKNPEKIILSDGGDSMKEMSDTGVISVPAANFELGVKLATNNGYSKINCQQHHIYVTLLELANQLGLVDFNDSIVLDRRMTVTESDTKMYAKIADRG